MTSRHPWTLVHAFYASTGGFVVDFSDHSIPNFRALTPMGIVHLMEHNPGSIPNLSVVDILDKSKTNSLSKVMALVQILWFCAQCIARLTQNLPISLLELNTFVHGVFAVVTCALWWHKPSDVAVPTVIQVQPEQFVKDNKPLDGSSRSRTHMPVLFLDPWSRGDEFAHEDEVAAGLTGVLAVFYGAIHVAAWNAYFPTVLEALFWRASAISTIVFGAFVLMQIVYVLTMPERIREKHNSIGDTASKIGIIRAHIVSFTLLLSIVARMFLVVESVRSLWFLPDSAYELRTWSRYIPHLG